MIMQEHFWTEIDYIPYRLKHLRDGENPNLPSAANAFANLSKNI